MAAFSERALAAASLVLRVLTLLLLIASLIIMVTDKFNVGPFFSQLVEDPPNFTFRDRLAFKYVVSAAVIGCTYTLLVLPFAVIHVAQGRKIVRGGAAVFLIFTDAVFAVLIATGAAAGLGVAVETQHARHVILGSDVNNFYNMVDLSCGLMLGATLCMVIMITISAHLLN